MYGSYTLYYVCCMVKINRIFLQVEDREVNHHGQTKTIQEAPAGKDADKRNLIARNEIEELKARKRFYANLQKKNKEKLNKCKTFGQKVLPLLILCFSMIYWFNGISAMK